MPVRSSPLHELDPGVVLELLPISGTRAADTAVTPGVAASRVNTSWNNAWARGSVYPFRCGPSAKVMTWSTCTPRSTRLTFSRLLPKRPADASRPIDSETCTTTSAILTRAAARAPDG